MNDNDDDLSEEEVTAIWQAINDLQPRLDHLPSPARGQVISALLGCWVSQHWGAEHREELMQLTINAARDMAKMVDAGVVNPDLMGTKGNA
jgi:hypothetical protein